MHTGICCTRITLLIRRRAIGRCSVMSCIVFCATSKLSMSRRWLQELTGTSCTTGSAGPPAESFHDSKSSAIRERAPKPKRSPKIFGHSTNFRAGSAI